MYLCGSLWRMASLSLNQYRNFFSPARIADIRPFFLVWLSYHVSKFSFSIVLLRLVIGLDL